MNSIDYYNDSTQWGDYQYITLEEVINNFMASRDPDDYTSNVHRTKVLYQSMRGLRELYYDVLREVRAIELELSPALTVTLPPDFVNYVRVSWVDEHGQLHPMAVDNKMSIAQEYLQDHEYNLLFDDEGCVLIGDSGDIPVEVPSPDSDIGSIGAYGSFYNYNFCDGGFAPNLNLSNVFTNGKYRIDKNAGVIYFGSSAEGRNIVLEYISDGLYTGCEGRPEAEIRIHKFAEAAILDFIYYELIKRKRNVPYNEKMRARKEYYNSRRITKRRVNTIRKDELLQAFRGSSKWIK